MPQIEVVFYQEDDGSVPAKQIDLAVKRKKKFEKDPAKHTFSMS